VVEKIRDWSRVLAGKVQNPATFNTQRNTPRTEMMSTVLSSVYSVLFGSSSVVDSGSSNHDNVVVYSEIITTTNREVGGAGREEEDVILSSLAESETTLAECTKSLASFEIRERHLGERIAHYRSLLARRENFIRELELEEEEDRLSTTTDRLPLPDENDDDTAHHRRPCRPSSGDDDVENAKLFDDVVMRRVHAADVKKLHDVVELHVYIIANVETLRRKMDDMSSKRDDVLEMLEGCRDYSMIGGSAHHD
jgi:hypothetical protein